MKKTFLTVILSAAAAIGAHAQMIDKLAISDKEVAKADETVQVSFTACLDRKTAPSGKTVIYAPVITDGEYRVSLPAIVVQGRRARRNWARHEWVAELRMQYKDGIYADNGERIKYTAEVPFQPWMHDSKIDVEVVRAGCCYYTEGNYTIADGILPAPEVVIPEKTVGERLSETFAFVLPATEFDPLQPIKFFDDERDNALIVYYKINKYDIVEDYANNRQTLVNLIAAINVIQESENAEVKHVVVAGFASPEGPAEFNDRLAWERAVSVKEHILKNTDMADSTIKLFNGSSDWRGLRLLVAADDNVPDRAEVLDVIDNHPVWDPATKTGRITRLRQLDGGRTYRYLADNIFPKLRNGAFIRVYFDNKPALPQE